jgi:hypothetical protein
MQLQYINTGTSPNAGNGDVLRVAFGKINNNFSTISSAFPGATLVNSSSTLSLSSTGTVALTKGATLSDTGQAVYITPNPNRPGSVLEVGALTANDLQVFPTDPGIGLTLGNTGSFVALNGTLTTNAVVLGTHGGSMTLGATGALTVPGPIQSAVSTDLYLVAEGPASPLYWINTYGDLTLNLADDAGSSVTYDSAGNVIVVGSTLHYSTSTVGIVIKYNSSGVVLWDRHLTDAFGNPYASIGEGVAVDSANNIYVFAKDLVTGGALIYKINSSGTIVWQKEITAWVNEVWDIAIDSLNNIYLTGDNAVLVQLDSLGNIVWQVTTSLVGFGYAIHIDAAGFIYVGSRNGALLKFNNTGALVWCNTVAGWGNVFGGVTSDAGNNVFASDNTGNVIKYNSNGTVQWQKQVQNFSQVTAIAVDSLGNLYISGNTISTVTVALSVVKLDTNGGLIWHRALQTPNLISQQYTWGHRDLAVASNLYNVTGFTYNNTNTNATTIAKANMVSYQLPTDGTLTGTYGVYVYANAILPTVTATSFVVSTASISVYPLGMTATTVATSIASNVGLQNWKTPVSITPVWQFDTYGGLTLPGSITFPDGTVQTTAPNSSTVNLSAVAQNIVPAANLTYDLGTTSSQWRSLHVGTSTIYLGGTALSVSSGQVTVNGAPSRMYPQTAIELAAGVTPVNYSYEPYNVLRYGADPSGVGDSAAAIQSCVNLNGRTYLPAGIYRTTVPIIVSGTYFELVGDGVFRTYLMADTSRNSYGNYIHAINTATVDTSYPTSSNPGPMSGSCFYFTSLIYYSRFTGMQFQGYKFAFAFLEPHNAPTFSEVGIHLCNAMTFCYQGSQNYRYYDCGGSLCGPIHISSAACYPVGTPYAGGDNYYTDGLYFENTNSKNAAGTANPTFDAWFQDSILRPTVASYSATFPSGYVYPFATTDINTKPSGWGYVYAPFRNGRECYGPTFINASPENGGDYGTACVNSTVFAQIIGYSWEAISSISRTVHFSFGAIGSLSIEDVITTVNPGLQPQVPFYNITGQGYSAGRSVTDNSKTFFKNVDITPPTYQFTPLTYLMGITGGKVYGQNFTIGSSYATTASTYDGRSDATIVVGLTPTFTPIGSYSSDGRMLDAWNFCGTLPMKMPNGQYYRTFGLQMYPVVAGLMKISVFNITTNETDYGEFYFQNGNASDSTFTTAAAVNNGDLYIHTTAAPAYGGGGFTRFTQFLVGGVTVAANSFDYTNNRIVLEGPVAGLSSTLASGSTVAAKNYFLNTVKPFQRNWMTFALYDQSYFPWGGPGSFAFVSNVATGGVSTMTNSDQTIYISASLSNVNMPITQHTTSTPTSGLWATGAIVYNAAPTPGGFLGWVCTSGGSPGTWKSFGAISA